MMEIRKILDILCCPECKSPLDAFPTLTFLGGLRDGVLKCRGGCGLAGVIEGYKIDFLHFDRRIDLEDIEKGVASGEFPLERNFELAKENIPFNDPRITYSGGWRPLENRFFYTEGAGGETASIEMECSNFYVSLYNHGWSGKALIRVDGKYEKDVDLYGTNNAFSRYSIDEPLPFGRHFIEVAALGEKNAASGASQVLLGGFTVTTGRIITEGFVRKTENRGNPYPAQFLDLVRKQRPDALILDCSGGDRQLGDDRYVNFEYIKYELADIYGDGHKLPFRDNTFDLVLSQAVMEHLSNPFKGADEIYRVMKPGGELWAEAAFMQPLHAVPYHFFNTTIWGIEELFKRFRKASSGSFGNLSVTFDWMARSTSVVKNMGEERYARILETFRELDKHVTEDEMRNIASAVWFHGIKERT